MPKWTKPNTVKFNAYEEFKKYAFDHLFEEDETYNVNGSARWESPDQIAVVYCTRAKGRNPLQGKPQSRDAVAVLFTDKEG
jgi:hypothetical protein